MKKDFALLISFSVCFLWLSFFPLGNNIVALRRVAFYLVYPASSSFAAVLEYIPSLSKSWGQLFQARQEVQRLQDVLRERQFSGFESKIEQQEITDVKKIQVLQEVAVSEFKNKAITFEVAKVKYRGTSPVQWVSRLCVEAPALLEEGIPAVIFDSQIQNFVFLGKTLPQASSFGKFSCVELITSSDFNLLVQTVDAKEQGLLRGLGEPGRLVLEFLPKTSMTQIGEMVVTSQASLVAPAGVAVGRVVALEKERPLNLFGRAYIEPFVDLSHVEEVVLLHRRNSW